VLRRFPSALEKTSPSKDKDALQELARKAGARDRESMRRLLLAVGPPMLRAVRTVLGANAGDAEDVMQEAAAGLVTALGSFKGECTVAHFACRVAVFSALTWRRRLSFRAQWVVSDPEAESQSPATSPSPAELAMAARRRQALEMLLDELPPPQAEVLVLHSALDFTVEEVAAAVGRPPETVRSRLRLAKRALRERIGSSAELAEILERRP
jgi:RNA polymerase sigma-70 factor (ECF subfamily)